MQTILGAGGAIGVELAKALREYTNEIRLVSRNPQKVNPGDELVSADLTDPTQCAKAIEGSEVVYLVVGLPYATKVWTELWPKIMRNTIDACKRVGARLVFFDNIYMYDPTDLNPITEELPRRPTSKKGKVRAEIARMLRDEMSSGELEGLIARSADFYGPSISQTSVLTETVFKPLAEGGTASWLVDVNKKHSFTYTPDAGRATALLGNTGSAFGEVWHLPTAPLPPTGKEWIEMIAADLGAKPKYRVAGKFMVKLIGLFQPIMREMVEMLYQYDRDYVFDSSKFDRKFNFNVTPYDEGVKEIVRIDYS